jgi:phenylalanyl-tRNA synthetase beta chain
MKVLLSWLREFAPDIEGDPGDLGEKLSALGLAVEEMTVTGEAIGDIVLAKVVDLRPHPDADKIQLVDVDAGDGEALQVACGAFNMSVGDLIPFAPVGTIMPNGMEIGRRKMRGEWSNGMCCSAAELDLGDDHDGIMILTDTAAGAELGAPITAVLGIERDVLWDLEVNANRPDAMSVAGVARDLAASLGVPFAFPHVTAAESAEAVGTLASVEIVDPTLCGRFLARVIRNVSVGSSPPWMANRLTALGMRPINSVVDASNYVMLELGQPNHTYDLVTVPDGHLRVRRATDGETITTLDGIERTLVPNDGVIADRDDRAIGIAGVMGGAETEISDTTTDVLLEMAWWDPPTISRAVKRLNLPSEASVRYRRGADYGDNMDRAILRFAQLLAETGATLVGGQIDERGNLPSREPVRVRPTKINGLLGTSMSTDEMTGHLESIGFEVSVEAAADQLAVVVPTRRWDTTTETDISEEIARLYGYENIALTVPKPEQVGSLTDYQRDRRLVRQILVGAGCDETHPMPFLAPGDLERCGLSGDAITLTNPLVAEESVLRTSLLPGQLKAVAYNQSHRVGDVRLFEIGHVYRPSTIDQLLPDEHEALAVCLSGVDAAAAVEVLHLLESSLALPDLDLRPAEIGGLHPSRAAGVVVAGEVRGSVGEVDPAVLDAFDIDGRVAWLELDLEATLDGPHGTRTYTPVSKFPSSDIDLAFVVPDAVRALDVRTTLHEAGGPLLVELQLFDVYRGTGVDPGCRSLAYRLRFQATDRTLTDAEVGEARAACIAAVETAHAAILRS